jgi:hypothetical protein
MMDLEEEGGGEQYKTKSNVYTCTLSMAGSVCNIKELRLVPNIALGG